MGLALEPAEPLSTAIRRMAVEQLDEAVGRLDVLPRRDDEAFHRSVHTARKALKKTRALLRLVRKSLGTPRYRSENVGLRDTARRLSEARDAAVLQRTLAQVADGVPVALVDRVDAVLAERHRLASRHLVVGVVMDEVVAKLARARAGVRTWPLESDDFDLIAHGLRRNYRQGQRALTHVRSLASDVPPRQQAEVWHEWRKRSKYLWYHLRVLRPVSPVLDSLVEEADELGELLGDDHDLAVLRAAVLDSPDRFGAAEEVEPLVEALDRRSQELRAPALELGRRLYLDEPDAFVRRLEVHWRAWTTRPPQFDERSVPEHLPIR